MKKSTNLSLIKIAKMDDKGIDYSDIPETNSNFWEDAELIYSPSKKPVSIRLDEDVIDWFKSLGKGYQTKINTVLKAYMHSVKNRKTV